MKLQGVFEEVKEFPDPGANRKFSSLVSIDDIKERAVKESLILLDKASLETWSQKFHGKVIPLVHQFENRPPLFIFAGDVGTGKTALAESFGDAVARQLGFPITLYSLSLSARGTGAVGEMTSLLSAAFSEVSRSAKGGTSKGHRPNSGVILLIDEADALAQSREFSQMHHEDRAGVNAVIRGIDQLAKDSLPGIVVMCTNRLEALDPAVRRRAAWTCIFGRPNEIQREELLKKTLDGLDFSKEQFGHIVEATGAANGRPHGYTFSDITQRLLPALVVEAFPHQPVTFEKIKEIIDRTPPTPPFRSELESKSKVK